MMVEIIVRQIIYHRKFVEIDEATFTDWRMKTGRTVLANEVKSMMGPETINGEDWVEGEVREL